MAKRSWVASAFEMPSEVSGRSQSHTRRKISNPNNDGISKYKQSMDHQLWVDKYCPQSKEELVVHKKKIAEVEEALLHSCHQNETSSVLLITGPSGCGKTATLRLLAKIHRIEVKEWINPLAPEARKKIGFLSSKYCEVEPVRSQAQGFWDFLLRANRYPSLDFDGRNLNRRIILVEDIPNVFFGNPSEFHSMMTLCYLNRCCIVFILNDDKSIAIKDLFPEQFKQELRLQHIRFNPIAATSMMKLLMRVCTAELSVPPTKFVLDSMVHMISGDVRLALNTLQFTYYSGNTKKEKYQPRKNQANDLQVAGERDQTLFIFHTLGKILHCKRSHDQPTDANLLPVKLQAEARRPFLLQPEAVVNNSALSSEAITLFLHQNYLKFLPGISETAVATNHVSNAATLASDWAANDGLEECSSLVAVRGFMHVITSPNSPGWQPIHKPSWYSANKLIRERRNMVRHLQQDFKVLNQKLLTEVLPFCYKILTSQQHSATLNFCEVFCKFPHRIKSNEEQLGPADPMNIKYDDLEPQDGRPMQQVESFLITTNCSEDEYEIENSD